MAYVTANFFSKALMRTVTVNVILPVDKMEFVPTGKEETKEFKTLYLLHGIFGDHTDWINGTRVQRWAQDHNLAVVMPAGENHFYVDAPSGEKYGEFIGKELVEMTRKMFPLSHKYEDTFIAGLSMGGYGALINGLKYSETFSHVAPLSAGLIVEGVLNSNDEGLFFTHTRKYYESVFGDVSKLRNSDKDYKYLLLQLIKDNKKIPSFYIACGTEDFLIEQNRDYYHFLKENNVDVNYVEDKGGHDWDFWDQYILEVIKWLPLDIKNEGISSGNVTKKEDK